MIVASDGQLWLSLSDELRFRVLILMMILLHVSFTVLKDFLVCDTPLTGFVQIASTNDISFQEDSPVYGTDILYVMNSKGESIQPCLTPNVYSESFLIFHFRSSITKAPHNLDKVSNCTADT